MISFLTKEKNKFKYLQYTGDEILNNNKIKVEVVESNIDIYNSIAETMVNKLIENNLKGDITSFILPVGPKGQYRRFAKICNSENISCRNLITINMDEYLDENNNLISEKHPLSFRGFMKNNLFDVLHKDLKVKSENIYFPDPINTSEIKRIIKKIGGADICFGGIGINGHIAFNEPIEEDSMSIEEFMQAETRVLDVSKETVMINSLAYGGNIEIIPKKCVTIGMAEIFTSKELKFYLEHNWQSSVLRKAIFWEPTPSFPATFLKEHKNSSITISDNVLRNYVC